MHGDADVVIPQRFGRRLFAAAPEKSAGGVAKTFASLPGANHNDVLATARGACAGALEGFVGEVVKRGSER
jgi:hypothetical protein